MKVWSITKSGKARRWSAGRTLVAAASIGTIAVAMAPFAQAADYIGSNVSNSGTITANTHPGQSGGGTTSHPHTLVVTGVQPRCYEPVSGNIWRVDWSVSLTADEAATLSGASQSVAGTGQNLSGLSGNIPADGSISGSNATSGNITGGTSVTLSVTATWASTPDSPLTVSVTVPNPCIAAQVAATSTTSTTTSTTVAASSTTAAATSTTAAATSTPAAATSTTAAATATTAAATTTTRAATVTTAAAATTTTVAAASQALPTTGRPGLPAWIAAGVASIALGFTLRRRAAVPQV